MQSIRISYSNGHATGASAANRGVRRRSLLCDDRAASPASGASVPAPDVARTGMVSPSGRIALSADCILLSIGWAFAQNRCPSHDQPLTTCRRRS